MTFEFDDLEDVRRLPERYIKKCPKGCLCGCDPVLWCFAEMAKAEGLEVLADHHEENGRLDVMRRFARQAASIYEMAAYGALDGGTKEQASSVFRRAANLYRRGLSYGKSKKMLVEAERALTVSVPT